jgi:hypothetical protein
MPDDIERLEPVDKSALLDMVVGQLRDWERLGGECAGCRRQGLVDKADIVIRFGTTPLVALQSRLHCTGCGNRRGNRFLVAKASRE